MFDLGVFEGAYCLLITIDRIEILCSEDKHGGAKIMIIDTDFHIFSTKYVGCSNDSFNFVNSNFSGLLVLFFGYIVA